jgi:hypothetical protein
VFGALFFFTLAHHGFNGTFTPIEFLFAMLALTVKQQIYTAISAYKLKACLKDGGTFGGLGGRAGGGASAGLVQIFIKNGEKLTEPTISKGSNGNSGSMGKHGENLLQCKDEDTHIKKLASELGSKKLTKQSGGSSIPHYKYATINVQTEINKYVSLIADVGEDSISTNDFINFISSLNCN